jgi:hypothetical protein
MSSLASDVCAERFRVSYSYLLALAELLEAVGVRPRDAVPSYLREELGARPGSEVLTVLRVFDPPEKPDASDEHLQPLLRVGDCTPPAVLASTPIHQLRSAWSYRYGRERAQGFFLQDWCDEALEVVVQELLDHGASRDRLETFAALLPEWGGSVEDLILAARSL